MSALIQPLKLATRAALRIFLARSLALASSCEWASVKTSGGGGAREETLEEALLSLFSAVTAKTSVLVFSGVIAIKVMVAMGTDKLMTEVDHTARAAYEERAAHSTGDRDSAAH